jgi:uncharacterized cupin superfamily protein
MWQAYQRRWPTVAPSPYPAKLIRSKLIRRKPMSNPILNLDEVPFDDVEENGLYTSKRGFISSRIGAKKLGYNLTVLPPGKVQCPFHSHHGEEEMFLILEG